MLPWRGVIAGERVCYYREVWLQLRGCVTMERNDIRD